MTTFRYRARCSSARANEHTVHIVHIGPSQLPLRHARGGAIERRMVELGAAQVSRGHQVTVYSAEPLKSITHFRGLEVRALACRHSGLARRWEFLFQAIADIDSADVLHFHSVPEGALLAWNLPGLKVLSYDYFHWRGAQLSILRWMYRHALKKFDALLPVSEFCRSESTRYWELPLECARVLYNGVNVEQFHPDCEARTRVRMELDLGARPVVLYVGRVCHQKGTDLLLEAYAKLRRRMPEVRLLVAGPAERFARQGGNWLTEEIPRAGGIYVGAVEETQLAGLYNACDIFVMPTREHEMFGMAALEAQACGKPVVCSRHGGLPEVVTEQSARFFPTGDSGALAAELERLLRSPEEQQRMAADARANAEKFSWQQIACDLDKIYAENQPVRLNCAVAR